MAYMKIKYETNYNGHFSIETIVELLTMCILYRNNGTFCWQILLFLSRSSVTRMSIDQKQNILAKTAEEERQQLEALRGSIKETDESINTNTGKWYIFNPLIPKNITLPVVPRKNFSKIFCNR